VSEIALVLHADYVDEAMHLLDLRQGCVAEANMAYQSLRLKRDQCGQLRLRFH
jgi:hypothetical protein